MVLLAQRHCCSVDGGGDADSGAADVNVVVRRISAEIRRCTAHRKGSLEGVEQHNNNMERDNSRSIHVSMGR